MPGEVRKYIVLWDHAVVPSASPGKVSVNRHHQVDRAPLERPRSCSLSAVQAIRRGRPKYHLLSPTVSWSRGRAYANTDVRRRDSVTGLINLACERYPLFGILLSR